MFEKKTIASYELIFLRLSGMRLTQEYEIIPKDSGAEISDYRMCINKAGDWERVLERRVYCPEDQMLELLNRFNVWKWDGFHGKHPHGVLDGEMFSFRATVNNGETIHAEGSANFPKNFHEFHRGIDRLLSEAEEDTE